MRYSIYLSHIFSRPCPVKEWLKARWTSPKITLGRWNLDECKTKINTKVDWANEDHCGPCGSKEPKGKDLVVIQNNADTKTKN